ncbi:MAG: hypothetical protein ACRDIB_09110, partial [Ardenticatenaceae bacterium]
YQPGMRPGINRRLAELAREIAFNAPEVIEALGYQPTSSDWAPMIADLPDTACDGTHLCVALGFDTGEYDLWAFVDLTTEEFVGVTWSGNSPESAMSSESYGSEGCPAPGTVNRDGWSLSHEVTPSDGLHIYDVSYNGTTVLKRSKIAEWHVHYISWDGGFTDVPGCDGEGGFPIYPYGDTVVLDLEDDGGNVIGFEVVQDFRMGNWGYGCNYRYEQHYQFFDDGRFRVVGGAYGQGCDTDGIYRPLVLIDVAVEGDAADNFADWNGSDFVAQTEELRLEPPNDLSSEGYAWTVTDSSGAGYYIEPGRGQFGDGGQGDNEFIYAVQHQSVFDLDMGAMGTCCDYDYHGPEAFVDGQSIEDENIALWYVPQMETDAFAPNYYCWTVTNPPDHDPYPCFGGPM